jgi:hypothetical protein
VNDEEYRGPAVLTIGDARHPVEVRMSARFEPVEGRFRWAGRADLRVEAGSAWLSIAGQEPAPVRLSEPDPWFGIRLSGAGRPPWFTTTS